VARPDGVEVAAEDDAAGYPLASPRADQDPVAPVGYRPAAGIEPVPALLPLDAGRHLRDRDLADLTSLARHPDEDVAGLGSIDPKRDPDPAGRAEEGLSLRNRRVLDGRRLGDGGRDENRRKQKW
jgi:hypothetical protein